MNVVVTADIVLSVYNGGPFLAQQLESVQAQTHTDWRLWVRDDGSTDGSGDVAVAFAERDPRIRVLPADGRRLGPGGGFGWLLERLPPDARYVFTCDADDVWLPFKIERTLAAMYAAEAAEAGPILVHTDLTVVDRELRHLAPSLWRHLGLRPEDATAVTLATDNVATGPTLLLNRALLDLVRPVPPEATHQDWWIALVAAAVGRIVSLPESTVLYRRHGANTSGPLPSPEARRPAALARRTAGSRSRVPALRAWIESTARQAEAVVERSGGRLRPEDRAALSEIAGISDCGWLERKRRLWRYWALPQRGLIRNLGLLLRG